VNPGALGFSSFYTIYEAGLSAQTKSIQTSGGSQRASSGNLTYISIHFPISPVWGLNVGIRPATYVNSQYLITDLPIANGNGQTFTNDFSSKGGLTRCFIGLGRKISKEWGVGVQASYVFGSIFRNQIISLNMASNSITNNAYENKVRESYGFAEIKPGILYRKQLSEEKRLVLGLTSFIGANLSSERFSTYSMGSYVGEVGYSGFRISSLDTLTNQDLQLKLPFGLGMGFAYEQIDRYTLTADVRYTDWSNFKDSYLNTYRNTFQMNLGAEFIPNINSLKSYFQRVMYRAGFLYEQSPVVVANQQINKAAVTLGLGLPIRKEGAILNVSMELGSRAFATQNLAIENYVRLGLGLTIHSRWFVRPKID
jgi:hypothetical protein